jgi:serine protease inhibitor
MLTSTHPDAVTSFGLKLFRALQPQQSNCLISPLSIFCALGMAYLGAQGLTQSEIATVLNISEANLDTFAVEMNEFLHLLQTPDLQNHLKIAAAVWSHPDLDISEAFRTHLQQVFHTEVYPLDQDPAIALSRINQWVSYYTEQKIPSILQSLARQELLLLLSAVYFKGEWEECFDPSQAEWLPFQASDGTHLHPLMYRSGKFDYAESRGVQLLSLPYQNNTFRMLIALPSCDQSIGDLISTLTLNRWYRWHDELSHQSGKVWLPRFSLEFSVTLNEALQHLGMKLGFTHSADFSGITVSDELHLSKVLHKAAVEVNESGSEAAAATAVVFRSKGPETSFEMKVDRPFLFAIEQVATESIVFIGSVQNPQTLTSVQQQSASVRMPRSAQLST